MLIGEFFRRYNLKVSGNCVVQHEIHHLHLFYKNHHNNKNYIQNPWRTAESLNDVHDINKIFWDP